MNLIDLLLELKIPVWLALILAVTAILAMTYYRHLLERKVRKLEHRLNEEATSKKKHLELLQERHRKRLDALDEVNSALMEFDHAVYHLLEGDADYANRLKKYHDKARTLSRQYDAFQRYTFQVLGSRSQPNCAERSIINRLLDLIEESENRDSSVTN